MNLYFNIIFIYAEGLCVCYVHTHLALTEYIAYTVLYYYGALYWGRNSKAEVPAALILKLWGSGFIDAVIESVIYIAI